MKIINMSTKIQSSSRFCLAAVALFSFLCSTSASFAQISTVGLPAASNTSSSFVDASIVRDSNIDQPLDLLNDFYPSIGISMSSHDNVRRRSDLDESDTKISVTPGLAYRTNLGRHQFYAAYSGVFTLHDELDQEDAQSTILSAQLGLDVSNRWDLNLFGNIARSFEERSISGTRTFNQLILGDDTGPDEVSSDSYGFDLIYGRKVSRLVATLGYDRNTSRYTNNFQGDGNFTGNRDRVSDSWHLDVSYQVASRTSVFARYQYTEIDYDRTFNDLDSEQEEYLIGLRWKPTNSLSGAIGVGASERDYIDPNREDYDGDKYYVNLNYALSPFSNIQLGAARNIEEPGDLESDYYVSDLLGVSVSHSFTPNVAFNAYAKWLDDDYNTDRNDEFFDWGVGLDYIFRPWLTLGVYYAEIDRDSSTDEFDYDDSYFGIRLSSDLRSVFGSRNTQEPDSFRYPQPVE